MRSPRLRSVPSLVALSLLAALSAPTRADVRFEHIDPLPKDWSWSLPGSGATGPFEAPAFALTRLPRKYGPGGSIDDHPAGIGLHGVAEVCVPAGPVRLLLRARGAARLVVDGTPLVSTPPLSKNSSGHEPVPPPVEPPDPRWHPLAPGDNEVSIAWSSDGQPHRFELWAVVGGPGLRPETGELIVAVVGEGEFPVLLGSSIPLTPDGWAEYQQAQGEALVALDTLARRAARTAEDPYWTRRHEAARNLAAAWPLHAPPGDGNLVDRHLGTEWPAIDDASFLRRLALDTTGVIPGAAEVRAFLDDDRPDRRTRAIASHLADPRHADAWMGYWQDVLAENPGLLKPTLNNTGPFRRFLYDALADNLPIDRLVTELVRMNGSPLGGGAAGFGLATQNDAPMAAKAQVLAKAFLAVEMKCARCHDAPNHPFGQADLFAMAGLLDARPQAVPATSTVQSQPGGRVPAVTVSLHAGEVVPPAWNFDEYHAPELPAGIEPAGPGPREHLAALITSPENGRFARVIVNRLWHRYLGQGLVEPVDDWDGEIQERHPQLLDDLARELVLSGYDLKHVSRLILESAVYQSEARTREQAGGSTDGERSVAPLRRRMTAEQLLDSLFAAAGKPFDVEELTLDPNGRRPPSEFLNLGRPRRAWELALPSNERDRPALTLPGVQTLTDVLLTFGWRAARPEALTVREDATTALQPAILANGTVIESRIARLSDDGALVDLSLEDQPLEHLVQALYLRTLSRPADATELERAAALLGDAYDGRIVPGASRNPRPRPIDRRVSWSNHLSPEATTIQLENERRIRAGDPPTRRLTPEFRERMEDLVWALVNSPEFVVIP